MKHIPWLIPVSFLFLASCNVSTVPVAIFADGDVIEFTSTEHLPADLLAEAGITLGPEDRIFYLGAPTPLDVALPEAETYTLTVHRAGEITLVTPDGTSVITTSASTVGQALTEAGIPINIADRVDPPLETPLIPGMTVAWQPAAELFVSVDGYALKIRSFTATVEEALSEAGIPLIGLDYAIPSGESPLPANGQIHIVRVIENVALLQKSLPYSSRFEASADLELDQQDILQAGEPGLAVSRVRVRLEDGSETSRQTEAETIVRPVKDRVMGYGTQVVTRTATVDGVTITYWRAVHVYATSYSPCRSGSSTCYYYTSSRKRVQKGVIAVASRWYSYLVGSGVYVPGYGFATVEDIGGGFPDRYWIDLGYSDDDFITWGDWVTLYFLTPVPVNIQYVLPYR